MRKKGWENEKKNAEEMIERMGKKEMKENRQYGTIYSISEQ